MKIIIAHDVALVRQGVRQVVMKRPGWTVVTGPTDRDALLAALRRSSFDILILGVQLRERGTLEILPRIRRTAPELPVLIFSMLPGEHYAGRWLRAGAGGFIEDDSTPEEIVKAITSVASGSKYITPSLAARLVEEVLHGQAEPHARLSSREFEVFRQIAQGCSPSEIAKNLNISVKTVSAHRLRVMRKTGFRTAADIVAYAVRKSLV